MGVTNCKHGSLDGKGSWHSGAREDHKVTVSTAAYSPAGGEEGGVFPNVTTLPWQGRVSLEKLLQFCSVPLGKGLPKQKYYSSALLCSALVKDVTSLLHSIQVKQEHPPLYQKSRTSISIAFQFQDEAFVFDSNLSLLTKVPKVSFWAHVKILRTFTQYLSWEFISFFYHFVNYHYKYQISLIIFISFSDMFKRIKYTFLLSYSLHL